MYVEKKGSKTKVQNPHYIELLSECVLSGMAMLCSHKEREGSVTA